jgi:hypothetical protein
MAHKHKQHRNVAGNALGDCRAVLLARRAVGKQLTGLFHVQSASAHDVIEFRRGHRNALALRARLKGWHTARSRYQPHFGAKQRARVLRELAR